MKPGYNCLTRAEYLALTAPRNRDRLKPLKLFIWTLRLKWGLL